MDKGLIIGALLTQLDSSNNSEERIRVIRTLGGFLDKDSPETQNAIQRLQEIKEQTQGGEAHEIEQLIEHFSKSIRHGTSAKKEGFGQVDQFHINKSQVLGTLGGDISVSGNIGSGVAIDSRGNQYNQIAQHSWLNTGRAISSTDSIERTIERMSLAENMRQEIKEAFHIIREEISRGDSADEVRIGAMCRFISDHARAVLEEIVAWMEKGDVNVSPSVLRIVRRSL